MAELGELYWTLAVEDNVSKELKTIQDALKGTNNLLVNLSDTFDKGFNTSALDSIGRSSAEMSSQMKSLEQLWNKLSFEEKFNGEAYSADAQKIVDSYRRIMESAKEKGKTLQGIIKEEITAQEKLIREQEKAQAIVARERVASRKSDMVAALKEQERATQETEKQRAKRVEILRVLRQEETTIAAIRQKLALMTQIQDKSKLDSRQFENARKEIERLNAVLGQYQSTSRTATAVNNQFATSAGNVARESKKQSLVVTELLTTLRNFAGFYFARDAVKQLAEVTGQFELQLVSLKAITQNADEAARIFGKFQTLAIKSPFQFSEIIAGAKQLAAFQVPLKDLYETTKIITDLSAGLGVDMGRIILAYGQVQAASVLRGQELRQFTEAGIPLVQLLADKFSLLEDRVVSTGEVFDRISTREVPFAMVKDIFTDLTSEGGMFFNMQEKQAETVKGKLSNLTDAYQQMLYQIGTANNSMLVTAIDIPMYLMSNWRKVSDVIIPLVTAFGAFKAVMFVVNALRAEQARITALATTQTVANTVATEINTVATTKSAAALGLFMKGWNKIGDAIKANWIGLLVAGIAAVVTYFYRLYSTVKENREEFQKLSIASEEQRSRINNLSKSIIELNKAEESLKKTRDGISSDDDRIKYEQDLLNISKERASAIAKLKQADEAYGSQMDANRESIEGLVNAQKEYNAIINASKDIQFLMGESGSLMTDNLKESILEYNSAAQERDNTEKAMRLEWLKNEEALRRYTGEYKKQIDQILESDYTISQKSSLIKDINQKLTIFNKLKDVSTSAFDAYAESEGQLYTTTNRASDAATKLIEDFKKLQGIANIDFSINTPEVANLKERLKNALLKSGMDDAIIEYFKPLWQQNFQLTFDVSAPPVVDLTGWRKDVEKNMPSLYSKSDAQALVSFTSLIDDMGSKYSSLTKEVEIYGKMTKKQLSDKGLTDTFEKLKSQLSELVKGFALFNQPVPDKGAKEAAKTKKDQYEEELTLIKKVYSDYKELRQLMGDEAAQKKIKELYKGLLPEIDMAFSPDQFISLLDKMSKKFAGIKAQKAVIGVEIDVNKEKLDNITKDIKTALDKAAKEVERHKEQFDIYKNLIAKGFEEGRAHTLAFGVDFKVQEGGYNIGQYLADKLAQSLDVTVKGLSLDFSVDTSFIEQIGDEYSKLNEAQRKQVEELEKFRFEQRKNAFMQYANLVMKETPEGMGLQFDISNVFAKYKEELVKLQEIARQAKESEQYKKGKAPGATEADRAEAERVDRNIKISEDANSKIALDKAKKLGGVYLKEKMEIAGLGEIYKNMSSASAASIESMLKVVRKSTDELLAGTQTRLSEMGLGEFATIFQGVFNAENLTLYTEELDKVISGLTTLDPTVIGKTTPTPEQVQKMLQFATAQRSVALNTKQVGTELQSVKADNVLKAYKSLGDSVKKVIDSVEGLGEAFGVEFNDISKAAIDLARTITDSTTDVIDTIATTTKASNEGIEATSEMASTSIQSVENASVILAIIGAALKIATAIANLFASSAKKKNEDIIKNSEAQIKRLENAYSDLDRQVNKALGEDVNKNQVAQIKNLEAQSNELNKQLVTVGKKGGLSNEEAEELRRRQVELKQQQEDLIDGIRDSILGTTKDMAQELGNAFFDAFANGEDAAIAWGAKVDEIVSGIVKKMLIQTLLEKPLGAALKKFSDKFINDATGAIDYGKIQEGIGEFADEVNIVGANFSDAIQKAIDANPALKDLLTGGGAGGKGTSEDIKAITEDTANRLAGYMNSMRAEMIIQSGYFLSMVGSLNLIATTASAQLSVLNSQLAHLNAMRVVLDSVYDPTKRALRVN